MGKKRYAVTKQVRQWEKATALLSKTDTEGEIRCWRKGT